MVKWKTDVRLLSLTRDKSADHDHSLLWKLQFFLDLPCDFGFPDSVLGLKELVGE
jgi:hypothetical protein